MVSAAGFEPTVTADPYRVEVVLYLLSYADLAVTTGFEPVTIRLTTGRSDQTELSHLVLCAPAQGFEPR
jgi:hypothetical protein